jgi:DHA1 family bicyclomycin/chloramphenicol resistance-like MFS transporter
MILAACVGLLMGRVLTGSALPLPIIITVIGVAALVLFLLTRGIRAAALARQA